MPICEKCRRPHDGSYGSGRFCSEVCARSFSSLVNKEESNKKVSSKMKLLYESGALSNFTSEKTRQKAIEVLKVIRQKKYEDSSWEELSHEQKHRRMLEEQDKRCWRCGIKDWMMEPIRLEKHHIDGNNSNEKRENCVLICPNCHSQTPNFRGRNKGKRNRNQISDEEVIEAVRCCKTLRQVLIKLDLSPKGANYESMRRRLESLGVKIHKKHE